MAKLQVYKFVSPGAGRSSAPEVAAARQSLLATNRLGSVITGIGSQVVDINKITKLIELSYENIYFNDKIQSIFTH